VCAAVYVCVCVCVCVREREREPIYRFFIFFLRGVCECVARSVAERGMVLCRENQTERGVKLWGPEHVWRRVPGTLGTPLGRALCEDPRNSRDLEKS
jgi:hypothetical protein